MLKDDIKAGESDRLEFKEQLPDNAEKWLKTVVAFANCRGGRILFGVSNSRKVKGLDCDVFAARANARNDEQRELVKPVTKAHLPRLSHT